MRKLRNLKRFLGHPQRHSSEEAQRSAESAAESTGPTGPAEPARERCPAHDYEREPHGLFVLYPPPEVVVGDAPDAEVDIVAVHGLNGTVRKTWRDSASGKLWLEDFLPHTIPRARIMTYGYDSGLAFSKGKAGIESFARGLLNSLRMMRTTNNEKHRPLVFVAHSLGGIVVKKALILAHETEMYYGPILNSTAGIVFMGTPHQGSELVPWAMLVANIVNIAFVGQAVRTDLIAALKTGSSILTEISGSFAHRSTSFRIMSFIEMQIERPLSTLVVPEYSARMNLPNEMVFPVNANHRSICRYPSNRDQTYRLVEAAIREIISGPALQPASGSAPNSATQPFLKLDAAQVGTPDSPQGLSKNHSSSQSAPSILMTSQSRHRKIPRGSESDLWINSIEETSNMVFVKVRGLTRKLLASKMEPRSFSAIIPIPADTPIADLKNIILEREPDALPNFEHLKLPNKVAICSEWIDIFTAAAKVTAGPPSHESSQGFEINHDQTIASFFSRAFPSPIQVQLRKHLSGSDSQLASSYAIFFGQRDTMDAQVSLLRSVRVPEDGQQYQVPGGLGTIPIYNVKSFSGDLPVSMVANGGIFVAMHDVEAMCLAFDSMPGKKFALRPYLGGVNGITGLSLFDDAMQAGSGPVVAKQDYVVIPSQERLDGITARLGSVRQFVATPSAQPGQKARSSLHSILKSKHTKASGSKLEHSHTSAATIEWQVTGKDSIGGIQLQIIPQFDTDSMYAGNIANVILTDSEALKRLDLTFPQLSTTPSPAVRFDVLKTPKELGLQEGDLIHIKDLKKRLHSRKAVVGDLVGDSSSRLKPSGLLELETHSTSNYEATFNIRDADSNKKTAFKFNSDDSIEDIIVFLQEEYRKPDGVLRVAFPVANDPEFSFLTSRWKHVLMLANALSGRTGLELAAMKQRWISELNFVFSERHISDSPRRICCLASHQGPLISMGAGMLMFAMPPDSTISDLCHEIEVLSGSSVKLFLRGRAGFGQEMRGPQSIFDQFGPNDDYKIPFFEVLYRSISHSRAIAVKTMTGVILRHIYAEFSDSVFDLKSRIQDSIGIPPDQQRLLLRGSQLDEERTVGDYNIGPDDVIFMVLRLRGGGAQVYIRGLGQEISIGISSNTVEFAKQRFLEITGIEHRRLILTYKGFELNDDQELALYAEKVLYVAIRPDEPKFLGIGAGGNIVQHIEPDESNTRLWDMSNSKIVHIQILNIDTFRSVTGFEPPPTPIHLQKEAGIRRPLAVRSQQSDKPDGVVIQSVFDTVQGVDAWGRTVNPQLEAQSEGIDAERVVVGYSSGGVWLGEEREVVTLDVDSTFPGLMID